MSSYLIIHSITFLEKQKLIGVNTEKIKKNKQTLLIKENGKRNIAKVKHIENFKKIHKNNSKCPEYFENLYFISDSLITRNINTNANRKEKYQIIPNNTRSGESVVRK